MFSNKSLSTALLLSFIVAVSFGENLPKTSSKVTAFPIGPKTQFSLTDEDSSIFYEDFESGWGEWTSDDVTDVGIKWHIDDFNGYNSTNSWWCGDSLLMGYGNHWLQYLVTPELDFSAAANPMLTFKLFYAVEDPGGAPAPYDGWDGCNVWASSDGGAIWDVITPDFPAYDCQSLYSFGVDWNMGPYIPGWAGESRNWIDAQFDLSDYIGNSQMMLRFALCSDPAYCTLNNPALWGMFLDDVSIDDGAVNLLFNDADGIAIPSEFTLDTGPPSGDWWEINDSTYHSPTHSANCPHEDHYNLSNAIISPWIDIPEGFPDVFFDFWLWCDMEPEPGLYLYDYYYVDATADGVVWDQLFFDYGAPGRPGAWNVGWELYVRPYSGDLQLNQYAGQEIKIRWRVVTNDTLNFGSGLHIDDFNVWTSDCYNHDVGAENMHIPFPTSLSNRPYSCTVDLTNFGSNNQSNVPAFWRVDSTTNYPLIPWSPIPAGQSVTKNFSWNPPRMNDYFLDSFTCLILDQDRTNDSTQAGYITVTDSGYYELGYDARQYTWTGVYYFNFVAGEGAMCKFVPEEHNISENIDITAVEGLFYSTGPCILHIYDEGEPGQPGEEIYTQNITVNTVFPEWQIIDISGITAMMNREDPFWVWFEVVDTSEAQIMGDDGHPWNEGNYYSYNGSSAALSNYEFYIRAIAESSPSPNCQIILDPINPPIQIPANGGIFVYYIGVDNSANPIPVTLDIWTYATLPNGTQYGPLLNAGPFNIAAGSAPIRLRSQNVPASAPSGIYTYDAYIGDYPNEILDEEHFDFEKLAAEDGGSSVQDWNNTGESFASFGNEISVSIISEFALNKAYPNPFNSTTVIGYILPKDAKVELMVYNILGERVSALVDAVLPAGDYNTEWDASGVTSAVYFYRIEAAALDGSETFSGMGKMLLIR
ncbi:T9SS type A sorting domain-containing protein [bacterium]|nr:T9SS type A sorting domain-containing protein [bacterium]